MTEKIKAFARRRHFFVYLLPLDFLLHGFNYNYNLVNAGVGLWILAIYLVATYFLYRISLFIFRNSYKAYLFTFCLLFINFFFGYMYDGFIGLSKTSFLSRYSFILAFTFLIAIGAFLWIKKSKQISPRLGLALNIFLLSLLFVECGSAIIKLSSRNNFSLRLQKDALTSCADCSKPDIYFILTDGYAGRRELKDIFNFDNSEFESALKQRQFHIVDNSSSNYNFTVLSLASTLNMCYINLDKKSNNKNTHGGLEAIQNSQVVDFFRNNGYGICNNSIFKLDKKEKKESILFPGSTSLLLGSTLQYHIARIVEFKLYDKKSPVPLPEGRRSSIRKSNELVYNKTIEMANEKPGPPRFIYTHLLMPHFPYFFDKDGRENGPEKILFENRFSKTDFLEYQQYVSKKLLALIDTIQKKSATPPIIILTSDHGFRQFQAPEDKNHFFSNISAIHLPDGDYSKFYEGMSNVNMFRVLLNTQFNQKLEILKDSSIFLGEKGIPEN